MIERARESLHGLSVGDGFGEKFFGEPMAVLERIGARVVPEPPWRYTDDTAMALSIVAVLDDHGRIDQAALAQRFGHRYAENPHRGYGGTAHDILRRICLGESWDQVAPSVFDGTGSMGNGGAMRVAPVGAYFADDPARAAAEARASAAVTHAHPEGQAGAIAIAVAAAWASQSRGVDAPDTGALFELVLAHTPDSNTRRGIAAASELPVAADVGAAVRELGNGSRVIAEDTVPFCLWCVARHPTDYVEAMWTTVSGLGDRDTTCAIVGGVVACATGVAQIPQAWVDAREPLPL